MDINEVLKRQEGENLKSYKRRLCKNKDKYNLSWIDVANLMNTESGEKKSQDAYRKWWYSYNEGYQDAVSETNGENKVENNTDVTVLKHEYENYEQFKSYKETIEINKDGSYSSDKLIGIEDESKLKDEDFLLDIHGYDSEVWQIISARNSMWNAQLKGGKVTKLYASKINVKPRTDSLSFKKIEERFDNIIKNDKRPVNKSIHKNRSVDGEMLEVTIFDLHLGKLGWSGEVGENFDYKIAQERFLNVIDDFVNRSKGRNIEKVIFPVGSDFFNFDTIEVTTTAGTRQDTDLRWQKMFDLGCDLLVEGIEKLKQIAPVEVFYIGGNHDTMISYYATNFLYAWYNKDEDVNVNRSPQLRKYIEFGKCLVGFTHGDKERKNIEGVMQVEAREIWGRTRWNEIHMGHFHSEKVSEKNGIIFRNLSSVTGQDAWHYGSGYVGAVKKAQAFIWNKEYGLVDIMHSVIA
jgi:hypothetical protein